MRRNLIREEKREQSNISGFKFLLMFVLLLCFFRRFFRSLFGNLTIIESLNMEEYRQGNWFQFGSWTPRRKLWLDARDRIRRFFGLLNAWNSILFSRIQRTKGTSPFFVETSETKFVGLLLLLARILDFNVNGFIFRPLLDM
ncbi:hypothetical protein RCL_jg26969.t2 [Rhizophagus clarus]|uniref:Uncharacterized protein n=1 Tax=Rhizophagus clarus TaxID=94130 RepID=A0A8H3LIS5_9GLOM|nr:hypothetical protein RCL_jg26969.t2 [Rhizophagus clarus]